jgi:hypothetical protein
MIANTLPGIRGEGGGYSHSLALAGGGRMRGHAGAEPLKFVPAGSRPPDPSPIRFELYKEQEEVVGHSCFGKRSVQQRKGEEHAKL